MQKVLFLAAATLLASSAQAQTHPAARPHAAPSKRPASTPRKAVAHPAPKPTSAPAAKPLAAAPLPATRPATAPVEPVTHAAPAQQVASRQAIFYKGSNAVNLGIGFGLGYGLVGSGVSSLPALSASYMRGVAEAGPGTISVGGLVGYKSYSWAYANDKTTWRNFFVGARGAYHYNFNNPKLDTYAGVGLGLRMASYSAGQGSASVSDGSQVELSGFVGGRYLLTNTIGAFAEMGYDMSLLKVGVSARF